MAKQLQWSVLEPGIDKNNLPEGLECCAEPCASNVVLYLSDNYDHDRQLLVDGHPDNLGEFLKRGRRCSALLVKVLLSEWLEPDWRFTIEYSEAAVAGGTLSTAEIQDGECYTEEVQLKLNAFTTGLDFDTLMEILNTEEIILDGGVEGGDSEHEGIVYDASDLILDGGVEA